MPAISFDISRTGDLSRTASVDWALEGDLAPADLASGQATSGTVVWAANETVAKTVVIQTVGNTVVNPDKVCRLRLSTAVNGVIQTATAFTTVLDDDDNVVIPAGWPYQASRSYGTLNFGAATVFAPGSDQFPSTERADGSLLLGGGDGFGWAGNLTPQRTIDLFRVTGTPPALSGTEFYALTVINRKCNCILALPNNTVLMWYANETLDGSGRRYTYCGISTDGGATWSYAEATGDRIFDLVAGDQLQVIGALQLGAGYAAGATGVDTDYAYLYFNNQGNLRGPLLYQPGSCVISLARVKIAGSGGAPANAQVRANYQFFNGLDGSGAPTWTSSGHGVPIYTDTHGMGKQFLVHYIAAIDKYVVGYGHDTDKIAVAHNASPWNPSGWQMLAYDTGLDPTLGRQLTVGAVSRWSSASNLWFHLSPGTSDDLRIVSAPLNPLVAAGLPYPRSRTWQQITFPGPIRRIIDTADQHPATMLTDGTVLVASCDRNTPLNSSCEINHLTGVFPNLSATARYAFGAGDRIPNVKSHAILSISAVSSNRLIMYYYTATKGAPQYNYSTCIFSVTNGNDFAPPTDTTTLTLHAFDVASAEKFMPRGLVQAGPGYGPVGSPPNTAPHWFDRRYIYLVGNNVRQNFVAEHHTPVKDVGLMYLCRILLPPSTVDQLAELNNRARYSFFKGLVGGVPQWTADGGLKTAPGVVPIYRCNVDGKDVDPSYFFHLHWHDRYQKWFAVYSPNATGIAIAHAPTLWDVNGWEMLCHGAPIAGLSAGERNYFMGGSLPPSWSATGAKLGLGAATYDETAGGGAGDNLILTQSSDLIPF